MWKTNHTFSVCLHHLIIWAITLLMALKGGFWGIFLSSGSQSHTLPQTPYFSRSLLREFSWDEAIADDVTRLGLRLTGQLWTHQLEVFFQTGRPKQRELVETCHLIAVSLLPYVSELEGFPSYPKQESPEHPRLLLAKFLDLFDLFCLCCFPHSFSAFILQACIQGLRLQILVVQQRT